MKRARNTDRRTGRKTTQQRLQAPETLRIDRWLYFCRFFKTRSQASAAVTGGHVRLNGERAASGKKVAVGDRIDLVRERLDYSLPDCLLQFPADACLSPISGEISPIRRLPPLSTAADNDAKPDQRPMETAMARALAEIEKEIRELARADQELLLRALLEELDGTADSNVEQAWLEEVQRRARELDEGRVMPISADEVFAQARAAIER